MDLPDGPVADTVLQTLRRHEHPAMQHHSLRTYLHARIIGERRGLAPGADYDPALLFYACALHDLGTAEAFDGPSRFEVEGADAAAALLSAAGIGAAGIDQVWEAIALHTSPQIAERRGPITMLTRLGVLRDFGDPGLDEHDQRREFERRYPRLEIERELKAAVVAQALRQPGKAPKSSWPSVLIRSHLGQVPDPDEF
ncbi:HD domain-containing protein [Pseudonocardia sp. GCM10023141]|uniref:HD domain-containing protein n=1 Tax=Pseudonocardia sp. GCM10023141 TaxID=3252653 RepID=UPI003615213E